MKASNYAELCETYKTDLKHIWLKRNQAQDKLDRKLQIASALGLDDVVPGLIELGANTNAVDKNGWSAVHWALACRKLTTLSHLLQNGGELLTQDNNCTIPLDFLVGDLTYLHSSNLKSSKVLPLKEVYTWGDGSNYALGHENLKKSEVSNPRKVKALEEVDIEDIALSQYHTAVITKNGTVFTWGFGEGGRLGYSTDVQVTPKQLKDLSGQAQRISVSNTHSALVMADGRVFTWGKGDYGQLGHGNLESIVKPKLIAPLKAYKIVDASVSNSHTCLLTDEGTIFTFGRGNSGQLGTGAFENEMNPRIVPLTNSFITSIATHDKLSVALTDKMDVYWWGMGFNRPTRLRYEWGFPSLHRAQAFQVVQIMCTAESILLLTKDYELGTQIYKFDPPTNQNTNLKEVYPVPLNIFDSYDDNIRNSITQICVSDKLCYAVTELCQVFSWSLMNPMSKSSGTNRARRILTDTRIHKLFVGTHHMAALIKSPVTPDVDFPSDSSLYSSQFFEIMKDFASTDVIINFPDKTQHFAHSFILSRSPLLNEMLSQSQKDSNNKIVLSLDQVSKPDGFKVLLMYLYSDRITFDDESILVSQKSGRLHESVLEYCNIFRIPNPFSLIKYNRSLDSKGKIKPILSINDHMLMELYGANQHNDHIKQVFESVVGRPVRSGAGSSTDAKIKIGGTSFEINAHSSVLSKRSDYFQMMLGMSGSSFQFGSSFGQGGWRESSSREVVLEEISEDVLSALIVYLYSERLVELSPNSLVELCITADRFLVPSLAHIAGSKLFAMINPLNAIQIYQLAQMINSEVLKEGCVRYIMLNLDRFLLSKNLNEEDIVKDVQDMIWGIETVFPTHISMEKRTFVEEYIKTLFSNSTQQQNTSSTTSTTTTSPMSVSSKKNKVNSSPFSSPLSSPSTKGSYMSESIPIEKVSPSRVKGKSSSSSSSSSPLHHH
eukprot:TRINITY_DN1811_c1_g1_i2.p1 TRINITY_DN1811_c1_g1~~TRINITY_DN1811_c1_g1_i2.p1  ORF type:complete len:946 (-),score=178.07 TRINITY_DN1811_c1_g1_i2:502-3339(-)